MIAPGLARSFARAIVDLAGAGIEEVHTSLRELCAVSTSPQMLGLECSPRLDDSQKAAALATLVDPPLPAAIQDVLGLALRLRMIQHLDRIVTEIEVLRREREGIRTATVASAQPLSENEQRRLSGALSRVTGATVRLEMQVQPSLRAGLRVRVGGRQFDNTVGAALGDIRDSLTRAAQE